MRHVQAYVSFRPLHHQTQKPANVNNNGNGKKRLT